MARSQMNFKLPDELIELLKRRAAEQGSTVTDLVIQGIQQVLGIQSSSVDTSIDLGIYERLQRLEERIDNRIDDLEAKLPA